MISKASVAFAKIPGTQKEKGRRFGVGQPTISKWERGALQPTSEQKDELETLTSIPRSWWDVAPDPPRQAIDTRPTTPDAPGTPEGTRHRAERLHRQIAALQDDFDSHAGTLEERARIGEKIASTLAAVGKITGSAILNERQILASPAWRNVCGVVVEALTPWPEALEAVAAALESLEASPEPKS